MTLIFYGVSLYSSLINRAVVATDNSLSTVEASVLRQSQLSRQGASQLPRTFVSTGENSVSTVAKIPIVATLSRQSVDNSSTD